MLKGPGRSGTEQNHIEAEFAMKGTHPPQAGLSFHGFFKIAGSAGEFRSVPQGSQCPKFHGNFAETVYIEVKIGHRMASFSVCPKKSDFLGIFFRKSSLMPKPRKSDG